MFSYETTVSYSRTDRNGKVPMHEILNLLQDCSTFHSEDIGRGVSYMKREARAWVLVAYKVIVNRPIMFGQKITIGRQPLGSYWYSDTKTFKNYWRGFKCL